MPIFSVLRVQRTPVFKTGEVDIQFLPILLDTGAGLVPAAIEAEAEIGALAHAKFLFQYLGSSLAVEFLRD